jgi:hypothetical protein
VGLTLVILILIVMVLRTESMVPASTILVRRRYRVIPPLQALILLRLTHRQEIGAPELAIQKASGLALEATASDIPITSGRCKFVLVEVDTSMKIRRPLGAANGGGIPITARQESGTIFLHGVHQYHVACANESGSEHSVAAQRLTYHGQSPIDKATAFVEVPGEAHYDTWPGQNVELRLGAGVTKIPMGELRLGDTQEGQSSLTYFRGAGVVRREPHEGLARQIRHLHTTCHAALQITCLPMPVTEILHQVLPGGLLDSDGVLEDQVSLIRCTIHGLKLHLVHALTEALA